MFGYVIANTASLSAEQNAVYRGYYCGLCRRISMEYGGLKRISLNYDMTFLAMLLSSLYDVEQTEESKRCFVHPLKTHIEICTQATSYAAAMNVALAYYNFLDNWHDDKSVSGLALSRMFKKSIAKIREEYPEQCKTIEEKMSALSDNEKQNLQDPDQCANIFGDLLCAVFIWKKDHWTPLLTQLAHALGRYIYFLDAIIDLPSDIKKDRYNPMRSRWTPDFSPMDYEPFLKIIMGECTDAFEKLPLIDNVDLLRNILYSGVWAGLYQKNKNTTKEEHHV